MAKPVNNKEIEETVLFSLNLSSPFDEGKFYDWNFTGLSIKKNKLYEYELTFNNSAVTDHTLAFESKFPALDAEGGINIDWMGDLIVAMNEDGEDNFGNYAYDSGDAW